MQRAVRVCQRQLSYLFKMAAIRHLGFVMRMFISPTKSIWRSLSIRCSSFDNMPILMFCEFGLKMPIHAFLGDFYGFHPRWDNIKETPEKLNLRVITIVTVY